MHLADRECGASFRSTAQTHHARHARQTQGALLLSRTLTRCLWILGRVPSTDCNSHNFETRSNASLGATMRYARTSTWAGSQQMPVRATSIIIGLVFESVSPLPVVGFLCTYQLSPLQDWCLSSFRCRSRAPSTTTLSSRWCSRCLSRWPLTWLASLVDRWWPVSNRPSRHAMC